MPDAKSKDPKVKITAHDHKRIYRMSNAGYCPKRLTAKYTDVPGEPKPPWLAQAAEEGMWHEYRIVQELKGRDCVVSDQQLKLTAELDHCILVGHIDGIVIDLEVDDKPHLMEIKSMSQFEFDRWKRGGFKEFPAYEAQIAMYAHALRKDIGGILYYVKNRNSGRLERTRYELTDLNVDIGDILGKFEHIEHLVARGELWPATFNPDSMECRRCEYKALCIPKAKELTEVDGSILTSAAETWRQAQRLKVLYERLMAEAKESFNTYAAEQPEKRFTHNGLAICQYPVSYTTYNKDKLEEIFTKEQLAPASKPVGYTGLKITDTNKEE